MKSFFFIVITIFLFWRPQAWSYAPSEGNISMYTGPFAYKTHIHNGVNVPTTTPEQLGLGFVLLGDINNKSSLEIGLFLFDKNYYRESGNDYVGEQTKLIHITMGYRRWFSNRFSGSITLYSAYSMGDVTRFHNDFSVGNQIQTSASDVTEYGFDFSFQTEVWERNLNAVVLDLRYSKSVTSKDSEDADHYGVLIGYRYLLQEKK